jgi:NADH-quinone oxidoreductase subunit M
MAETHWLSLATFLPLAGALGVALARSERAARILSLVFALGVLAITIGTYAAYTTPNEFAFVEEARWIDALDVYYRLGADGTSLALALLTALLTVVAILCSWTSITERVRGYYAAFLVLETGMLGVFYALDLFLFYLFWEGALIPMYLIIGIWGGPRRIVASVKFVIFTVAGSVLMLVAILFLYFAVKPGPDQSALDMRLLPELIRTAAIAPGTLAWLFGAFALAFLIKVPAVPFHTWLPDAHVEAPTAGSVILAGILLKMGVYGFIRLAIPFFPEQAARFAPAMIVVGLVGIVFGALMAMAQHDIKKLIAYSSVSHMGFCIVGLFAGSAAATQGAVLQMINHGLSTGALFALVGVVYERTHKRGVDDFGGLAAVTPAYATVFLIATLSSIGLPGLNGFVGEVLVLFGTYQSGRPIAAAVAGTGVILGAIYMLRLYRVVFFGRVPLKRYERLPDLTATEMAGFAPLLALMALIGVFPWLVLHVLP